MNRDDRILAVMLTAEHLLRLSRVDLRAKIVERFGEVFGHRLPGPGPLREHGQVVDPRAQRLAQGAIVLEPPPSLEQRLRRFLILPEIRLRDALFYFGEFVGGACGVKDSSAGRERGARDPRTCEAVRRC